MAFLWEQNKKTFLYSPTGNPRYYITTPEQTVTDLYKSKHTGISDLYGQSTEDTSLEQEITPLPTDYRILVNTANTGTSASNQFNFTGALGNYDVEVWDSTGTTLQETITGLSGAATITIAAGAGSYELRVMPAETGGFNRIQFNDGGDKLKLIEVRNWGTVAWSTMVSAYFGCANLNVTSTDVPDLSGVTSMASMFRGCTVLNGPANIGDWNTSAVTNMSQMFNGASAFNQPIGDWNTGAVTNMSNMLNMFRSASAFNQPLNTLTVDAVTNFATFMFGKTAANYDAGKLDAIYQDWTDQQLTPALSINFGTIEYTAAGTAGRNLLTRANATVAVTGAVANTGEVQITAVGHGLSTGDKVLIYDVGGTVEADGGWIITVVDVNNFTLNGSTFTNTYTSGGTVRTGFGWTVVDGGAVVMAPLM